MRILDFHCHVYPDAIAEKASKSVAAFYNCVPGVDIHDLTGTLDHLLEAQYEAGIDISLLSSAATAPHQVRHINEFLARCVEKSQGRCVAFGTLHPDSEDIDGDIAHLKSLGLLGVKLHPDMQKFALNDPKAMNLYEAANNSLPFLLHTGDKRFSYSNEDQLRPVLEAFPQTVFVGAHLAGYSAWKAVTEDMAGKYDNLWVDLSSSSFSMSREEFYALIKAYGADRVLFGTDFPMWWPAEEVETFLSLPLTKEEKRKIAWDNGAAILGL